jgi:hypothetical protein
LQIEPAPEGGRGQQGKAQRKDKGDRSGKLDRIGTAQRGMGQRSVGAGVIDRCVLARMIAHGHRDLAHDLLSVLSAQTPMDSILASVPIM